MQQKPKVLCVSSWYPHQQQPTQGNFVQQHLKAASQVADLAFIHVVLSDTHSTLTIEEQNTPFYQKLIYIPRNKTFLIGIMLSYFQVFSAYWKHALLTPIGKPQLIHAAVLYPVGLPALLLKWRFRVPLVFSEHWTCYHEYTDPQPSKWQKLLLKWIGNRAKLILPVSLDLAAAMQRFGIKTHMKVVPNVVDTQLFCAKQVRPHQQFRFVHISSLDPLQKNFHLLINAFAALKKEQANIELHVVSDGDFQRYAKLIEHLDFAQSIHFHGQQDAAGVAAILQFADAFVLTSRYENLPCVLIESLACGTPVIATNVGGVSEIVNAKNGILIPSADLKALIEALKDIQNFNYIPSDLHQEAAQKYSQETIAAYFSGVYKQVLPNHVS
jgi:glycosyltransferase involved in cell wall biosynthesis